MVYLCAAMALCVKMVLAYRIGTDMTSSPVTDTVRDALNSVHQKGMVADGLALHSGYPYDTASMDIFFGTPKVECLFRR